MTELPLIQLRRFGVAFGGQIVLGNVHLDLPARGMHVLLGPAGAGKSTLLRTLAGLNDRQPALRTWGHALIQGEPLAESTRPALVHQHVRLLVSTVRENLVSALEDRAALSQPEQTNRIRALLDRQGEAGLKSRLADAVVTLPLGEQRIVAILRSAATASPVLLADEPTASLDEEEAARIVGLLRRLSEERLVIVVTHNQAHARALGGVSILLAGGRIQELERTQSFFTAPKSDAGREFVGRGTCSLPGPAARPEDLSEGVPAPTPLPVVVRRAVEGYLGPRDFYWIEPGRLGGMPRPGIVNPLEQDLEALTRLGVTMLVTLEEPRLVAPETLARFGMRSIHFPIPDMRAPDLVSAASLCDRVATLLDAGDVVVMHCLAGLGRTGTMLAAQLVWRGVKPLEAIETVRSARPRSIQSEEQAEFLMRFWRSLSASEDV
jgi:atypical dual specificity phosphatase